MEHTGDVPGLQSVAIAGRRSRGAQRGHGRRRRPQEERRRRQQDGDRGRRRTEGGDAGAAHVVQVIRAARPESDRGLRRAARPELVGVDPQRQTCPGRRLGHFRQVLERERDVLHVHVDLIRQGLGRGCGDQFVAGGTDPSVARQSHRNGVTCEERHRARLRDGLGKRTRQARLPELRVDRQPVARLQLHRRRPMSGHLLGDRAGRTPGPPHRSPPRACGCCGRSRPPRRGDPGSSHPRGATRTRRPATR